MTIEYKALPIRGFSAQQYVEQYLLDQRGRMFCLLVEKWGMVAAIDSGEDSVGRSKLALLTVDAVIARAAEMAEKAMAVVEAKGWYQAINVEELPEKTATA